MPYFAIDTCCKCGKEINVKDSKRYRVREDYRLVCENCAKPEAVSLAVVKERKPPAAPAKK